MTENEFEVAKNIVFDNIINLTNSAERPPTDNEFNVSAAKVKQILPILGYTVSDEEFEKILRTVRANFTVQMDGEEAFIEGGEHKKWLDSVKSNLDWFFWTRYENYLRHDKKWLPALTAALNTTTNKILDLMGNPNSTDSFNRRGLIIGEVQSGKTATYTALCAKAADTGYKIIIVLTGTLEDLRRQTQARLDLEFAGRESQIFLSTKDNTLRNRPVGVAKYGQTKDIAQFTSVISDFKAPTLDNLKLGLQNLSGTVLLVVKKNKSILKNLFDWLKKYSVKFGTGKINHSLLLLDDEADNASINTHDEDEEPTAINNLIRKILNLFSRTTYIGVTATPFANIFIMPFDEQGMLNDDLFPKDFIYSLDVPNNYIGADAIFDEDGKYKSFLVPITPLDYPDVENYFPKNHRIALQVDGLPESLCTAMDYFLLVNAIRDLRGDKKTHRTMLIHVSRFKSVHAQIYDLVNVRLHEIVSELRAYAALPVADAERESDCIKNLHRVFDTHNLKEISGVTWEKILHEYLRSAVEPIQIGLRNSSSEHTFSYEQNPNGLRIIAIGGNSFTRGLTLEGLCVTYFYRNSKFYDTLMQMGRWFGYRPNYDDLCRLWTSQEIIDWYGYVAKVSNELKREIMRMENYNKTPQDFGLKVRRHPDTLEITARNKIRSGTAVVCPVELNRIFLETPRLINDKKIFDANNNLIREFVDGLGNFTKPEDSKKLWCNVPKNLVAQLVLNFKTGSWARYQARPISEYIYELEEDFWDVYIPEGLGATYDGLTVSGKEIKFKPVERSVTVDDDEIKIGGQNLQVGTPTTTQAGLTKEQIKQAEEDFHKLKKDKSVSENAYLIHGRRPLLVIFAIRPKTKLSGNIPEILFALGVGFPALDPTISESQVKTARFIVNAVGNEEDIEE